MDRYVRFEAPEGKRWGKFEDGRIVEITKNPSFGAEETDRRFEPSGVKLLPPVEPTKIVCVGLNYRAHVDESQSADKVPEEPVLFMKPTSALLGPGGKIEYPEQSQRVDYEAELGVIIGRECTKVAEVEAEDYIYGYSCCNDITARDLQKKDGQWTRGKGFNTFCPVGPWLVTGIDYSDLKIESFLNGDLRQSGRTSMMIFSVPFLIAFISKVMTLYPGDLILTGTPSGIGPMKPGDRVEVRIEGIGSLVNDVV